MAEVQTEQASTTTDATVETVVAEAVDENVPQATSEPVETQAQHFSRNEAFGFDDDTIGWLENKGFENAQAMVTSQRELEKKMGGPPEMLQKWPESDDKDGFDAIYRRLGTPEDTEGYKIEFEEGAAVDPDTLAWFKQVGLEHKLTNNMLQGLALSWNTEAARLQEEQQQALEVKNQTEETELRNSWGTKYDERLDYGHRALIGMGLSEENIDSLQGSLGVKMVAQFAAKIADTMGEDTIAAITDTPAFGTTKEQVQTQINELNGELGADKERFKRYYADQSSPKESTGKDYRKMQQLEAQLESLIKVGA